jgi:phosphocarrier protein FPr
MVGIVIVSHSKNLALGLKELALQMVKGTVNIEIAAGIDDPDNPLGTDPMQIYHAIERVYSDDGVVIFMDLGSAILSAEMAIEFLSEAQQHHVKLSDAPLVEGVISAVIQASVGGTIEQVLREANATLTPKSDAIKMTVFGEASEIIYPVFSDDTPQEILISISNLMGLHARPAAKLVQMACQFTSDITLCNVTTNSIRVNAKSISQVMGLGVRCHHQVSIAARGFDATEALDALQGLSLTNFGESEQPNFVQNQPEKPITYRGELSHYYQGVSVSPGIAIAPLYQYQSNLMEVVEEYTENPHAEWEKLQSAIEEGKTQIKKIRQETFLQVGETHASIFDAHLLCLQDPIILERVSQLIFTEKLKASSAWSKIILTIIQEYKNLSDSYLQARDQDWEDVGNRVGQLLTKNLVKPLVLTESVILVAEDLTPSQVAQLDISKIVGLCMVRGSTTSHAAILAHAIALPCVIGLSANLLELENGTPLALDGETGEVWIQPDAGKVRELESKKEKQDAAFQVLQLSSQKSAITADGKRISIMANISGFADAKIAKENGAEGIGVFRTEFLYLDREQEPNEDEQRDIYQTIAQLISPHPLIIRVLDIGGDKPLSFTSSLSNLSAESNPFLGLRGIRVLLEYPDLLKRQLRAILRAGFCQNVKLLLPMISSLNEVRKFKEILDSVKADLAQQNIPFIDTIEIGIMIEVPAAVAIADKLAKEVDFFSIGTNDLTQYIMACDRTNPQVAYLADGFEPAVLRMIQQTVIAAHNANILVTVCGELASSPLATPILLGLGVDELSVTPSAIPIIKSAISQLTLSQAHAIASEVLELDTAAEVRKYLTEK